MENTMNQPAKFRLLAVSFFCLALGGCAGAWLVQEATGMVSEGSVSALQNDKGYVHSRPTGHVETSKEDVLSLWGSADKTFIEGESEVLIYPRELGFSGMVVLLMGVNIPFLIPIGYRHTHLYFNDGILTKIIQKSGQDGPGFTCGLMFNISSGGWSFECGKI